MVPPACVEAGTHNPTFSYAQRNGNFGAPPAPCGADGHLSTHNAAGDSRSDGSLCGIWFIGYTVSPSEATLIPDVGRQAG